MKVIEQPAPSIPIQSKRIEDVSLGTVFQWGNHTGLYLRTNNGAVNLYENVQYPTGVFALLTNYEEINAHVVVTR